MTIVKNSNEYLASSYDGDAGNKRSFMTQTIVDLAVGDTVSFCYFSCFLHNMYHSVVHITSEFMGKTFQAAQLTHERFLTTDHSCKIFF